tara:strand:+ start:2415 stop:3188 length:774 start_codon:yes stop_codon:yes gene_type:complete
MKIAVASGGFDPIHGGHISYLKSSKEEADLLIVAINSDEWLIKKKGKFYLPYTERKEIIESLEFVDKVIAFSDDDLNSCIDALERIKKEYPNDSVLFCNGGDRTEKNIPEKKVKNIKFLFNVGGSNKLNSSSEIIKKEIFDFEDRIWGKFFNLLIGRNYKLKELIVHPGKGMSLQRHNHRSEIWFITKGQCSVNFSDNSPDKLETFELSKHDHLIVNKGSWHQIFNKSLEPCHIIEIQFGERVDEKDIERLRFYENN